LNQPNHSTANAPTREEINDLIIASIQDIKGKNIVKLDLRELHDAPTDFFIICEGDSSTQVKAIADNILKKMKETYRVFPSSTEGTQNAKWVCVDYFTTVVHIFYPETRGYYDLDQLWSDAKITSYETI
jgi:ribosome-associated protein